MQVTTHISNGANRIPWPLGIGSRALAVTTFLRKAGVASVHTLLLCFGVLLLAPAIKAQTTGSGSIQGTVTDPTGALVANASVTLVESSTQVTLTTKTSSAGVYAFPNINVGTYSLTVAAPSFETYTSTGNVLEIGSSIAINPKLTVGSAEVKVEVHTESTAALLQTQDASFKQTVDST